MITRTYTIRERKKQNHDYLQLLTCQRKRFDSELIREDDKEVSEVVKRLESSLDIKLEKIK